MSWRARKALTKVVKREMLYQAERPVGTGHNIELRFLAEDSAPIFEPGGVQETARPFKIDLREVALDALLDDPALAEGTARQALWFEGDMQGRQAFVSTQRQKVDRGPSRNMMSEDTSTRFRGGHGG